MSDEQEHIKHLRRVAADAVAAAMRVTQAEFPRIRKNDDCY
jgi:hypothetical protein